MTRPLWAEVSRSRLLANFEVLRQAAPPGADLLAVVKANAYGHGVLHCAPLLAAAGAAWLGVTDADEGARVRAVCPEARILLMSGIWRGDAETVLDHRLTPVVWDATHLDLLETAARKSGAAARSLPVHLEIDTGMARQGVSLAELSTLLERFTSGSPLDLEAVMTHFSEPEVVSFEPDAQVDAFARALAQVAAHGLRPRWVHAGNSATLLGGPDKQALATLAQQAGARLLLRPGLALYGYVAPYSGPAARSLSVPQVAPVLAWKARITSLRNIGRGDGVGYNSTFRAGGPTRLALLPVGYADGLDRALSNVGHVLVRGQSAPIAGRVSMDQTTVEVTHIPEAAIGDEVVLIGTQGQQAITAWDLARQTGTIAWEVLCGISCRVPRVLID